MISESVVQGLVSSGKVNDADVLALRRTMFGDDHQISAGEAEALFQVNDACHQASSNWPVFFVESIVDFLISNSQPNGYISESQAQWLTTHIAQSGVVKGETELETLVKLMEMASAVPDRLELFAMNQVKNAVLEGSGPTRKGSVLEPGKIGTAEIELLRRILYACASQDSAAISRFEAEMVCDINDAIPTENKSATWTDFFVKVVANYLMAVRGFQPISREQASHREAWLNEEPAGSSSFFARMLAGGVKSIATAYSVDEEHATTGWESEATIAEAIDAREADWLIDRMGDQQNLDEAQRALLLFIKLETSNIHPRLKPLIDQVA